MMQSDVGKGRFEEKVGSWDLVGLAESRLDRSRVTSSSKPRNFAAARSKLPRVSCYTYHMDYTFPANILKPK